MYLRKFYLITLFLTLSISAFAQPSKPVSPSQPQLDLSQPIPMDRRVLVGKLDNGLTYYIQKNTKPEKKVELRLAVNAGSILERDDQRGLAHFVEHMAFNGTENFKKNDLIQYLQSIGVQFGNDLNAFTSFDETVYMLSIPTEKPEFLDKGLLVLRDWAGGITLDPAEIDKERGVVLEEMRIGTGAGQRMRDRYFPKLFNGSQYALRLPIGTEENLKTFKPQALIDFYEDWYRPDLMAVVAVGDFDPKEMESKIKAEFSNLKAKRPIKPRTSFAIPDRDGTEVAIETDKEETGTAAQILFIREKFPNKTLKDFRDGLIRSFHDTMFNQRISEISNDPNSPFVSGGAGFGGMTRNNGAFSVFVSPKPNKTLKAINKILEEIKRAQQFGFNESEFERAKIAYFKRLERQFKEMDKTDSENLVMGYVFGFLGDEPVKGIENTLLMAQSIVPTIKIAEINALGKDTISDKNRVAIITGPNKPEITYPKENEILASLNNLDNLKVTAYVDKVSSEPLVGDLATKVKVKKEQVDKVNNIIHWTLSNGINVWIKPTEFKADEILMKAFSFGGTSVIPDDKMLQATYSSVIAGNSGVGKLSNIELGKKLAGKQVSARFSFGDTTQSISGNSTPNDLETMLQLVFLRFTNVNFEQKVLDTFIEQRKAMYSTIASNPEIYFLLETQKIESQGSPRVFFPNNLEDYSKLNLDQMKAIYYDRFADASGFNFLFVGNIDPEKDKGLLLKYLGSLPVTNRNETWKVVGPEPFRGPFKKVFYKGEAEKSSVLLSVNSPAKFNYDDQFIISSMGKMLENRLTEVLREEKGGVYGAGAGAGMSRIPRETASLSISFPCGPQNVETLTKAAVEEFKKIQNGQIDQKEIDKIIESELVDLRKRDGENQTWLNRIQFMLQNKRPILTHAEFEARAKALSIKEIQRVAKQYFDIDKRVEFVLMPAKYAPKK